jgi:hypothetical protein
MNTASTPNASRQDVIDPHGPDSYLYCLGTWIGYTITLDKYPDQVLWTRNGIRGRSRVWLDITTMCVYDCNGPNANKKNNARIVVRHGEHSDEELPPIVEPLLNAEQRGWEISCNNTTIKLDHGIRGRQAMLVGPDGTIFFGVGPNYGMVYEGVKMPMNAQSVSASHQVTASTNQTRKPAMSLQAISAQLATANIKHIVVSGYGDARSIKTILTYLKALDNAYNGMGLLVSSVKKQQFFASKLKLVVKGIKNVLPAKIGKAYSANLITAVCTVADKLVDVYSENGWDLSGHLEDEIARLKTMSDDLKHQTGKTVDAIKVNDTLDAMVKLVRGGISVMSDPDTHDTLETF